MSSLLEFNYGEKQDSVGEAEAPEHEEDGSNQIQSSGEVSRNGCNSVEDDDQSSKVPFRSISRIQRELPESNIGWPLLRKRSSLNPVLEEQKAGNRSFFEWISSLPCRVSRLVSINQKDSNFSGTEMSSDSANDNSVVEDFTRRTDSLLTNNFEDDKSSLVQEVPSSSREDSPKSRPGWPRLCIKNPASSDSSEKSEAEAVLCLDQSQTLKIAIKLDSCSCNLFTYEELKLATNAFSAENLIGEGGCSNVYKGQLPGGKAVAVKVLKQYKEAWNDFSLEVDIMSSLRHGHITPLIGICNEHEFLILVYNFLTGGSLEENLQGRNWKPLPWKVRFKVAVAMAEALDYLHSNNTQPVIHRDVKSSNILLSKDYHPRLSDFGLATWGPKGSNYTTDCDLVGTFGYIAPEYFMHGLVGEKIDVYSYGVVLLELLTGKKPISSGSRKRKQSLVQWATPLLENGNLEAFLDPKIEGKMDTAQMHRMVVAATLCIKQTPMLRPNMKQVLQLLTGKENENQWYNSYIIALKEKGRSEVEGQNGYIPKIQDLQDYTEYAKSFETTQQRLKLQDYLNIEQD